MEIYSYQSSRWLKNYLELPLLVYDIVRHVPTGRVTTYAAIAETVGIRKASPVIGFIMNLCRYENNPVPVHRVVNKNGVLTKKHQNGSEPKVSDLLFDEGIWVANNQISDFDTCFWHPSELYH